jgi:stearoyl-CoA desaturase (delta-9 desaturase)
MYYWIPFHGVGALLFLFGELGWFGPRITGLSAFLWGFEVPVTLVFYALVAINLLTHLPQVPGGYRRYDTPDGSTNRVLLGMVTSGAGFHNNHHRDPGSARCGVAWWELDISYYFTRALQFAGLARNVRSRLSNS